MEEDATAYDTGRVWDTTACDAGRTGGDATACDPGVETGAAGDQVTGETGEDATACDACDTVDPAVEVITTLRIGSTETYLGTRGGGGDKGIKRHGGAEAPDREGDPPGDLTDTTDDPEEVPNPEAEDLEMLEDEGDRDLVRRRDLELPRLCLLVELLLDLRPFT